MGKWDQWDYKEPNDWKHDWALVQKVVDHELRDHDDDEQPRSGAGSADTAANRLLRGLDAYAGRVPALVAEHQAKSEVFTATSTLLDARETLVNDRLKALSREVTRQWPTEHRPLIGDEGRDKPYAEAYAAKKLAAHYANEFMECFWGEAREIKPLPREDKAKKRPKDWSVDIDTKLAKMSRRLASSSLVKMVEVYGRDQTKDEIRNLFWTVRADLPVLPLAQDAVRRQNAPEEPAPKRRKSSVGTRPMALAATGSPQGSMGVPRSTSTSAVPMPRLPSSGSPPASMAPGVLQSGPASYTGAPQVMDRVGFSPYSYSSYGTPPVSSTNAYGYRSYTQDPFAPSQPVPGTATAMPMNQGMRRFSSTIEGNGQPVTVHTPGATPQGHVARSMVPALVRQDSDPLASTRGGATASSNPSTPGRPSIRNFPDGYMPQGNDTTIDPSRLMIKPAPHPDPSKQIVSTQSNSILQGSGSPYGAQTPSSVSVSVVQGGQKPKIKTTITEPKLADSNADQDKTDKTRVGELTIANLTAKMSKLPSPTRSGFTQTEGEQPQD